MPSMMYVTVSKPRCGCQDVPLGSPGAYSTSPISSRWMNGSRSARSTPANARLTGNPRPSVADGALVTDTTGRGVAVEAGAGRRGRTVRSGTVMAGTTYSLISLLFQPPLQRPAPSTDSRRPVRHVDTDLGTQAGVADQLQGVAGPELARVVVVRRPVPGEEPHRLVGAGDHLRTVRRLQRRRSTQPATQPAAGEARRRGERGAVRARDGTQQRVLHLPGDGSVELPQPGVLVVPVAPLFDRGSQVVQLRPAMVVAGPHVGQPAAELGVPYQRRQIVEDDGHSDVVDGRVRDGTDSVVCGRPAAEQPQVAGAGQVNGRL